MLCNKCGASLPDTAAFCSNCGAALRQQPPQPNQTPQSPPQPYQQPYQPPQVPLPQSQPQYQQPLPPQKKKHGVGLVILVLALLALFLCAMLWGLRLLGERKKAKEATQPAGPAVSERADTTAAQPGEPGADEADPNETDADETDAAEPTAQAPAAQAPADQAAAAAPGETLGKLEGFWTADADKTAFIRFSAEQYGWAVYMGYYYSELEVYAHMDGELRAASNGYLYAHFSEPASEMFPAFDFDLWIDAAALDEGKIRCLMCDDGAPDFSEMEPAHFAGRTEEEAMPGAN